MNDKVSEALEILNSVVGDSGPRVYELFQLRICGACGTDLSENDVHRRGCPAERIIEARNLIKEYVDEQGI